MDPYKEAKETYWGGGRECTGTDWLRQRNAQVRCAANQGLQGLCVGGR